MFKNERTDSEKAEERLAEYEQNRRRNFSYRQAGTVHTFSAGMVSCTTALVLSHCYVYWKYGLMQLMLKNVIFCILAESFVVCWGIFWWGQLAPKLLAAKAPLKNFKYSIFSALFFAPFYVLAILADIKNGATPIGSFTIVFILLGGRVLLELGFAWLEYRKSAKYKTASFVEYCNEIRI